MKNQLMQKIYVCALLLSCSVSWAQRESVQPQDAQSLANFTLMKKMTSHDMEKIFLEAQKLYAAEEFGNCQELNYAYRVKVENYAEDSLMPVLGQLAKAIRPNAEEQALHRNIFEEEDGLGKPWTTEIIQRRVSLVPKGRNKLLKKDSNLSESITKSIKSLAAAIVKYREGDVDNYLALLSGNDKHKKNWTLFHGIVTYEYDGGSERLRSLALIDNTHNEIAFVANGNCVVRPKKEKPKKEETRKPVEEGKKKTGKVVLQQKMGEKKQFLLNMIWSNEKGLKAEGTIQFNKEIYDIDRLGRVALGAVAGVEGKLSMLKMESTHVNDVAGVSGKVYRCDISEQEPFIRSEKYVDCDKPYNTLVTVYNGVDVEGLKTAKQRDNKSKGWDYKLLESSAKGKPSDYAETSTTYCMMVESNPKVCE